jgi:hypothetical protein
MLHRSFSVRAASYKTIQSARFHSCRIQHRISSGTTQTGVNMSGVASNNVEAAVPGGSAEASNGLPGKKTEFCSARAFILIHGHRCWPRPHS